jgi:pilus assembly protein CpaD
MPTIAKVVLAASAALRRHIRSLSILLVAAPLGACGVDRMATGSITPEDYRVRHPLVLTHQDITLDIFPEGPVLDQGSRARIKEFAANYKDVGEGPLTILLPQGTAHDDIARQSLAAIRKAIVASGVTGAVRVGVYPVADPARASPVRISFVGLKATVMSRCGEWPDDLASGGLAQGWENHPYWNQGCAYQTAFAAQVADPRDLVSPRAEQPSDVEMRMRAISRVRQGEDPGTNWTIKNSTIGQGTGGN